MEHRKINKAKKTGKKSLATLLFSRIFMFCLMLLIQLSVIMVLAYNAADHVVLNVVLNIVKILLIVYIVNSESDPTMKMTWILFIVLLPALGTLMYIYVKFQIGAYARKRKLEYIYLKSDRYLEPEQQLYNDLQIQEKQVSMIAKYIYDNTGCPVYRNTKVTYLDCGESKYKSLIEALEAAENFIFLEYFIIEEGRVWNSILRVLEKKVQQGVEVRVMYDGLCSLQRLELGYFKKLRKKGIKAKPFAPARPFFTTEQNNRDHRKILVIDGKIAFTGGINLADEYMNIVERFGYWKDTAVKLEGDAAKSFTLLFLQMWNVSEKNLESFDKYLNVNVPKLPETTGYVIGYGDDPYGKERIGESVYLHIANTANRYLHIVTPYLVLDNVMMASLKFASKRGVDVKLIMPGIPDKGYAYCLARTYYLELIQAGVEIYEYTPGFTHAKMFVSDDEKATVGTINLDYRSLYLHFENGCFIYKDKSILNIEKDFQEMLSLSKKVTVMECRNRTLIYKACGKLLRLLSPLM